MIQQQQPQNIIQQPQNMIQQQQPQTMIQQPVAQPQIIQQQNFIQQQSHQSLHHIPDLIKQQQQMHHSLPLTSTASPIAMQQVNQTIHTSTPSPHPNILPPQQQYDMQHTPVKTQPVQHHPESMTMNDVR
jgi:hypothetical protein